MKKENYCVYVPDLRMVPIIKQTLEINGEKFNPYYRWDRNSVLLYSSCDNMWYWGAKLLCEKKQIVTFGQLIDLLNEPKKIAVRVENEKEFKAIEKYLGKKPYFTEPFEKVSYPAFIYIDGGKYPHEDYVSMDNCELYLKEYSVNPFSDFAAEHNIKLPLLTSEDGVDLYEGDNFWHAFKDCLGVCNPVKVVESEIKVLKYGSGKAFSTQQAALDWIEAQKPKNVIISPNSGYPIIVYRKPVCGDEYIHLDMSKRGDYNGANIHLTIDELRKAIKAYDEMHS